MLRTQGCWCTIMYYDNSNSETIAIAYVACCIFYEVEEIFMNRAVSVQQARELILSIPYTAPAPELVSLMDSYDRVLAEDVKALIPIPPFDRSPFDGYAFRGEDTSAASAESPVTLKITEELPAGAVPTIGITAGFAAKILTGAPIPAGANATVKYEETAGFTDDSVTFTVPAKPDSNIVYAGEDVRQNDIIARRGTIVSPAAAGLFASAGHTAVPVFKRPVVAILNTGTELCEPGNPLPFGKIYNSSVFSLMGTIRQLGLDAYNAGVVRDDPDEIARVIDNNLAKSDVVITTGGASVGEYDFSVTSAQRLGANTLFWKSNVQPGGALVVSELRGKLILGLSGNPGAALISLLCMASPFLKRLSGQCDYELKTVEAALVQGFKKSSGEKARLLRGSLELKDGRALFVPRGEQGGGVLSSFMGAELIVEIPPNTPPLPKGSVVRGYLV